MKKNNDETSLFQLLDREQFDKLCSKWEMDKGVRAFTTWEMTCALLTSAALGLGSLREIELSLGVSRSTFSDALKRRCHGFFSDLCDVVICKLRHQIKSANRKAKRGLREVIAIDATECFVHGSLFTHKTWVRAKMQGNKAGIKLHAVYSVDGNWIDNFLVTGNKKGDSPSSLLLRLEPNKIYVFDRAYNDLKFWLRIRDHDAHFVTRLKDCKKNRRIREEVLRKSGEGKAGVLFDGLYEASVPQQYRCSAEMKNRKFRHIIYRDPSTDRLFDFVTSDFGLSAQTIADIYKRRWAIELFFRWLKGHLNIRYLPLRSTNGVKIQISIALLLQLLLQLKRAVNKLPATAWELLRSARTALLRRSLNFSSVPDGCRWRDAVGLPLSDVFV